MTATGNLAFVLAFGDLSYLEICTVLEDTIVTSQKVSDVIAFAQLKETGGYEKLTGVHKVALALTPRPTSWSASIKAVEDFLGGYDQDFNFSVSFYSQVEVTKEDYEVVISDFLKTIRAAGFRKANLIRPRGGTEMLAKEILSRKIVDFVLVQSRENFWTGVTCYIPDIQQFQLRSNERPVVSSDISISSRLARLLLNVGGAGKGLTVLDPFCGSGTILMEALMVGADCVGVDRDPVRIENAKRNLKWLERTQHISNRTYSLKTGDATKLETVLPGVEVDLVVSEPIFLPRIDFAPSLERARKLIRNSSRLYSDSLYSIASVIRKGGRAVLVAPSLRTAAGKDVSVLLENVNVVGLKPYRPVPHRFEYPVHISNENTRWVRRLIYVFERT
jgi:tRNA G10  N-methylase Trm11